MRIFADKLADHLNRQLSSCYMLFGTEPLLLQESRDAILAAARRAGFEEKHNFTLDAHLDWNQVFDCCTALSLFASKQIIELEIPESGVTPIAAKSLVELSSLLHPEILLLVVGSKLAKAQENASWFKQLNQIGLWVSCLTPDLQRLPQFVRSRCQKLNLVPDNEALQMLAQWHEGNLLALAQSLEKLALLYPDGQLTLVRVETALSRNNHYTPYHWIDALLAGKANRAQRILRQLEAEDVEPVILMRAVQRELILVNKLLIETQTASLASAFDKHRIWQNKRAFYQSTLQRLNRHHIHKLIQILTLAEVEYKSQYSNDCWSILTQLSLLFCQPMTIETMPLPIRN